MEEEYLPREHLAYIAGFFDGEGCISIAKTQRTRKNLPPRIVYFLRCSVTNTNLLILQYLVDCFGGHIHAYKPILNRRPCWQWSVSNKAALEFLYQVIPHLKLKDKEAKTAIAFQEFKSGLIHGRGVFRSSKEYSIMDEAYGIMKTLKTEVNP